MRKLFISLVLCLICVSANADFTGTVTRVIDGDTIIVTVGGENKRVRMYGIDAPELKQAHGEVSRDTLSEMIQNQTVQIIERGTDQYQRIIGIVMHNGIDIGGTLVLNGFAWCYRLYDKDGLYAIIEYEAKSNHRGLWGAGTPVAPWVFRKEQKGKS